MSTRTISDTNYYYVLAELSQRPSRHIVLLQRASQPRHSFTLQWSQLHYFIEPKHLWYSYYAFDKLSLVTLSLKFPHAISQIAGLGAKFTYLILIIDYYYFWVIWLRMKYWHYFIKSAGPGWPLFSLILLRAHVVGATAAATSLVLISYTSDAHLYILASWIIILKFTHFIIQLPRHWYL